MFALPKFRVPSDTVILGTSGRFPFKKKHHIPIPALGRHYYSIGVSGSGKSKAQENNIVQLIENNYGCGLLDPHSLLLNDTLRHLISRGISNTIRERIIIVDPTRRDYVMPFNVLATPDDPYHIGGFCILPRKTPQE